MLRQSESEIVRRVVFKKGEGPPGNGDGDGWVEERIALEDGVSVSFFFGFGRFVVLFGGLRKEEEILGSRGGVVFLPRSGIEFCASIFFLHRLASSIFLTSFLFYISNDNSFFPHLT